MPLVTSSASLPADAAKYTPALATLSLSLAPEVALLRAVLADLAAAPPEERKAVSERAADTARVVSVLIHAIESERALHAASTPDTDAALSAIIARALDAFGSSQ